MRRVVEGARGGSAALVIPVTLRLSAMRERKGRGTNGSMTIVYAVGFRNGAGELLEETLLPIAVECAGPAGGTGPARSERRSELCSRTWRRCSIRLSSLSPAPGPRRSRPHTATTCPGARRAGGRCRDRCRRRRECWFNPASSGVQGCVPEQKPPVSALLDDAPIEEAARRKIVWQARVEAVICGTLA